MKVGRLSCVTQLKCPVKLFPFFTHDNCALFSISFLTLFSNQRAIRAPPNLCSEEKQKKKVLHYEKDENKTKKDNPFVQTIKIRYENMDSAAIEG